MIVYLIITNNGWISVDFQVHFGMPKWSIPGTIIPLLGHRKLGMISFFLLLSYRVDTILLQRILATFSYKAQSSPLKTRQTIFRKIASMLFYPLAWKNFSLIFFLNLIINRTLPINSPIIYISSLIKIWLKFVLNNVLELPHRFFIQLFIGITVDIKLFIRLSLKW